MENIISTIVQQQIPLFLKSDSDLSEFLVGYYEWLEKSYDVQIDDVKDFSINLLQSETSNTLPAEVRNIYSALTSIKSIRDSDTTPVSSLPKFIYEYMNGLPLETASSIRSNLKLMKNFYENKGNENSVEFLFNLLYKETVSLSYPSDRIVSLSSSKWLDKTYIRLLHDNISSSDLDLLVGTYIEGSESGARGYLDSYTSHDLISKFQDVTDKNYYKLILKNVDSNNSFVVGDKINNIEIMSGIGNINYDSSINTNLYPTTKIKFDYDGPVDDQVPQSFGAAVKIKEFKKFTIDSSMVTIDPTEAPSYSVNLINDFLKVYEYEYDPSINLKNKLLRGQKSGAIGTIVKVDPITLANSNIDASRIWIKDINGTFLSDYQANEQGASELVDVITDDGSVVTSLRIERKYSACKNGAILRVDIDGLKIDYKGADYIFNPIEEDDKVVITGIGQIEELDIIEMGNNFTDESQTKITVDGNILGTAVPGVIGTEKSFESTLNTLDGEAKLRDSNYYQEFSYEIKTQVPMVKWRPIVTQLTHPAGMKIFGREELITSPFDLSLTVQPDRNVYFDFFELHEIEHILITYSAMTEFNMLDTNYNNEASGSMLHSYEYGINWNDSSFVTDYGQNFISKVFFNNYSSNVEYHDVETNSIINKSGLVYDADLLSEEIETSESVNTTITVVGNLYSDEFQSELSSHDRNQKADVDISYNLVTVNLSSQMDIEFEEPEETHDIGVTKFNFEFDNFETGASGEGTIADSIGYNKFMLDFDTGEMNTVGEGGQIVRNSNITQYESFMGDD